MKFKYYPENTVQESGLSKVLFIPSGDRSTDSQIIQIIRDQVNCLILAPDPENALWSEEDLRLLQEFTLAVIAVSSRLLRSEQENTHKLIWALRESKVLLLPILLDSIDLSAYSQLFGDLQYLDFQPDFLKRQNFESRMRSYLQSVILEPSLLEKIRSSFHSYIFVSYRKKDWAYAQDFLDFVQSLECTWDVGVWYDDFLMPGEDFSQQIFDQMKRSELITLLVTPKLEEKNYISEYEYPAAVQYRKKIIPVQMEPANTDVLKLLYAGFPPVFSLQSDDLRESLQSLFENPKTQSQEPQNPQKLFYLGLAYLRGVDTKRNPARAIPLLNQAAEKGVDQALLVLSDIYLYGDGVPVDPRKGVEFLKRYFAKTIQSFKDQPSTETIERLLDITIRYLNTLTRLGWFEELNTTCASVLHPILLLLEDIPYDLSPYDSTPFKILFYASMANCCLHAGQKEGAMLVLDDLIQMASSLKGINEALLSTVLFSFFHLANLQINDSRPEEAKKTIAQFWSWMKKVPRELTDLACGWKYQILELEIQLAQEQQDFRKESELCKQMEKLADKSGFLSQTQARSIENQRLLNQADQEYAAGQYRLCIETYSRFLEADAVTLEQDILQAAVRRTMAEAYRKLNRTDEAIKCVDAAMHSLLVRLKESQEARKEMIACLFCRAEISEQNNDWLSADHCYQRALNHLQKLTGPKYSVKNGQIKEERKPLRIPKNAVDMYNAAQFYEERGKLYTALSWIDLALDHIGASRAQSLPASLLESGIPVQFEEVLWDTAGRILKKLEDCDAACRSLETGVSLTRIHSEQEIANYPGHPPTALLAHLALCYLEAGAPQKADQAMEEACQSAVKYLSHTDLSPAQLEDWLDMTDLLRDAIWDSKNEALRRSVFQLLTDLHAQAIQIHPDETTYRNYAESWKDLARIDYFSRPEDSLIAWKEALNIWMRFDPETLHPLKEDKLSLIHHEIASLYLQQENHSQACAHALQSIKHGKTASSLGLPLNSQCSWPDSFCLAARACSALQEYEKARQFSEDGLKWMESLTCGPFDLKDKDAAEFWNTWRVLEKEFASICLHFQNPQAFLTSFQKLSTQFSRLAAPEEEYSALELMDTLVIALKDFSLTSYELESQSCEILICLALCCTPNGKEMRTAARLFEIWMADAEAIHNSLPDKTWKIPLACLKVHFYESVYARKSDNTVFHYDLLALFYCGTTHQAFHQDEAAFKVFKTIDSLCTQFTKGGGILKKDEWDYWYAAFAQLGHIARYLNDRTRALLYYRRSMLLAAYKLNLFPCSITILQMVKASEFTLGMYYSSRQYKEAKALFDQIEPFLMETPVPEDDPEDKPEIVRKLKLLLCVGIVLTKAVTEDKTDILRYEKRLNDLKSMTD